MTETIRYALVAKQDLALGTGTVEITLADGRVVVLDKVNIALIPSGLTAGSVPFVGSDADKRLDEDATNFTWDDTNNVLSVLKLKILAGGTIRAVDSNAQLIHAWGTTT